MAISRSARKRYSIAEARQNLAAIVHGVERRGPVEVTRRGQPVAVLVGIDEYARFARSAPGFWPAYQAWRQQSALTDADVADFLKRLERDRSRGRSARF